MPNVFIFFTVTYKGIMTILEDIHLLIDEIKKSDVLVIVEGINDKKALHSLGIKKIKTCKHKAIYKLVEEISDKEVIILTDLDKEGKKLYSKLNHELNQRGIYINNKLRHFLFKNTKLRQIEGMDSYLEKLNL